MRFLGLIIRGTNVRVEIRAFSNLERQFQEIVTATLGSKAAKEQQKAVKGSRQIINKEGF